MPVGAGAHSARANAKGPHTYFGPAVRIGHGSARVIVTTDKAGQPGAVGVVFTAGMLEGLPAKPGKDPELDHYYFLNFPRQGPATGYSHLMVNWHPMGHLPKGIYTVPHFDFHFYLTDEKSQMAIHYAHPETMDMTDVTMPAAALMPAGYFIPPGTQVSEMGVHAVPKSAPELHGKPFVNTFIYGFPKGQLVFLEPMITRAWLLKRTSANQVVALPKQYSLPGYYPTQYRVSYDAKKKLYTVLLGGLKPWQAGKLVAMDGR